MAANDIAYGFTEVQHLFNDRLLEIGSELVLSWVQESLDAWNRENAAIMNNLVVPTTMKEKKVWLPLTGSLEPLDANSNPKTRRYSGSYEVGYPIRWAGTAFGLNRESRVKATVADLNRFVVEALKQDKVWQRTFFLKAILWSQNWTFVDETRPDDPDLTVRPFANGDTVTYTRRDGTVSTDNHYLAQAAAIADLTNPFPTIFDELYEHPSNAIDMDGYVLTFVSTSLEASIAALSNLREFTDQLIIPGIQNDRADNSIIDMVMMGDKVIGIVDNNVIVRWSALPSGYMFSYAPSASDIVVMREEPEPELQGFFQELADIDGNHQVIRMLRKAGFAVNNRVAGLLYYIGNAAYQDPTGYNPAIDV